MLTRTLHRPGKRALAARGILFVAVALFAATISRAGTVYVGKYPSGVSRQDLQELADKNTFVNQALCYFIFVEDSTFDHAPHSGGLEEGITLLCRFTGMSRLDLWADAAMRNAIGKELGVHILKSSDYSVEFYYNTYMLEDEQKIIRRIEQNNSWLTLSVAKFMQKDDVGCFQNDSPACLDFHLRLANKYRADRQTAEKKQADEYRAIANLGKDLRRPLGGLAHREWFRVQ